MNRRLVMTLLAAAVLAATANAANEAAKPERGWAMKARDKARVAVKMAEGAKPVDGAALMDALVQYGDACELVQEYDGAIAAPQKALNANRKPFQNLKGDEDLSSLFRPRCIVFCKIGYVYLKQDNYPEAEQAYVAPRRLWPPLGAWPPRHPRVLCYEDHLYKQPKGVKRKSGRDIPFAIFVGSWL